jgi:hypothetical protein
MPYQDPDDTTVLQPSWWSTLGGEGPKPYSTESWAYTQTVEEEEEEEEESSPKWWETLGGDGPKPYSTASWAYQQTVSEENDPQPLDPPEWWETLGGEGPKPYETAAWVYTQVSEETTDQQHPVISEWWDSLGGDGPKPYSTASWTFSQLVSIEEENEAQELGEWWESLGGEGPKPYASASWSYLQTVFEEITSEPNHSKEWWETLGGEGPKPYETAAWIYTQEVSFVLEFVAVSESFFFAYDEGYYPRLFGFGVILDSGYFGQVGEAVYDEAYYLGGQRGILMKRKLARVLVYDKLADAPGILALPEDDRPPGTLLGSVSYELFDDTVTITDWEHLNWQDDTPVLQAVRVLINELPDCVKEVRVLDSPRAFWTSLGFEQDVKGDQYLHLYL